MKLEDSVASLPVAVVYRTRGSSLEIWPSPTTIVALTSFALQVTIICLEGGFQEEPELLPRAAEFFHLIVDMLERRG